MTKKSKTWDDVLAAWAVYVPPDMTNETSQDKLLDSCLRFFDGLSAARITNLPSRRALLPILRRAMQWQWIALNISMPTLAATAAPAALTLMIVRWLTIWQQDKTLGAPRLMAAIDRDIGRLFAAAQYLGIK